MNNLLKQEPHRNLNKVNKIIGYSVKGLIVLLLLYNLFTTTTYLDKKGQEDKRKKFAKIEEKFEKQFLLLHNKVDSLLVERKLIAKEKETIIKTYEVKYKDIAIDTNHVQAIIRLLSEHSRQSLQRD